MDAAEKIAATQAAAAFQLAEVAGNLQRAAAEAQGPTQRLLLMRQLRKVHEAYRALTQVESVNTQSVPIQLPAASLSEQPEPRRGIFALRRGK